MFREFLTLFFRVTSPHNPPTQREAMEEVKELEGALKGAFARLKLETGEDWSWDYVTDTNTAVKNPVMLFVGEAGDVETVIVNGREPISKMDLLLLAVTQHIDPYSGSDGQEFLCACQEMVGKYGDNKESVPLGKVKNSSGNHMQSIPPHVLNTLFFSTILD